jgi:hypothetical protein
MNIDLTFKCSASMYRLYRGNHCPTRPVLQVHSMCAREAQPRRQQPCRAAASAAAVNDTHKRLIFVVNTGSSSLKFKLYAHDTASGRIHAEVTGLVERIGDMEESRMIIKQPLGNWPSHETCTIDHGFQVCCRLASGRWLVTLLCSAEDLLLRCGADYDVRGMHGDVFTGFYSSQQHCWTPRQQDHTHALAYALQHLRDEYAADFADDVLAVGHRVSSGGKQHARHSAHMHTWCLDQVV